jgi:hypothetical protein
MPAAAQASAIDDSDPADAWERALLDHQIESLNRLAAMGMTIAGAIERQVTAAEPGEEAAVLHHAALDFGRISRAVRMSFALQSRLIADFKTPPAARGAATPEAAEAVDIRWLGEDDLAFETPAPPFAALRDSKLGKVIRHIAECTVEDQERLERVFAEAAERLEQDDIHRLVATRPFGEVIALICRDLGLEPDWARVPHKPARLGWAIHDDFRAARDFSPPPRESVGEREGLRLHCSAAPAPDSS